MLGVDHGKTSLGTVGRVIDWNQIVADHGRHMYVLAQRVLGNHADAEEVVQDVFAEAFRREQVETVQSWPGLLRRLAMHRALDRLRKRRALEQLQVEPAARNTNPSELAQAHELAARLRAAIDELPRQQAATFCLRYFDGLSYDDIACALEIENGAVATAIYKARVRLRELLDPAAKETER